MKLYPLGQCAEALREWRKTGGLGNQNSARAGGGASRDIGGGNSGALLLGGELDLAAHRKCVKKASSLARDLWIADEEALLQRLGTEEGPKMAKRLKRMEGNGAWLTRLPNHFEGTELTGTEWHDNLAIRYGMRPVGLPQQCDGCRENFSVRHALTYKKGGLVTLL